MLWLDSVKYMKLYKKPFVLPVNKKDTKHNAAILLLTPNYESSNNLMHHPLAVNKPVYYQSYYVERDIMYTINHESRHLEIAHNDYSTIINEQPSVFIESTDYTNYESLNETDINPFYCKLGDKIIFFNEMYDEQVYNEKANYNNQYKRLLYNDRIRNNREVFNIYDKVKQDNPWIKKTFIDYKRYNGLNLFIDLHYYNEVFLGNNNFTMRKSIDLYLEFINRFINDERITNAGYYKRTVFVPVNGWDIKDSMVYDYLKNLNPISVIYDKLRMKQEDLSCFDGIDFIFLGDKGYFKFNTSQEICNDYRKFIRNIKALVDNEVINDDDTPKNSPEAITASIVDKMDKSMGIKVHSLTGEADKNTEDENMKAELVSKINDIAKGSSDEEEVMDKMDEDPKVKELLNDLQDSADEGIKISATRMSRIAKARDELMQKKINNRSVKDMINNSNKPKELPERSLPIDTINEEWKHLKGVNFEKEYDLNADIVKCLDSLSYNKKYPISVLNIDVEDKSTSEDSVWLYTVKCEDFEGKRFTLKFYIPKFRDDRYMRLRGNEKTFTGELPLLPISKTDEDTVQIATFYNKIFVYRYNTSLGRSNEYSSKLVKALERYDGTKIKITKGDNRRVCSMYELPIDYIDLASVYSKIETSKYIFYFNQDEVRSLPNYKATNKLAIGKNKKTGELIYFDYNMFVSEYIADILRQEDTKFNELFTNANGSNKYTYSRCKVMNTFIPIIVVLAHDIGLTKAMELANIKYEILDRPRSKNDIKFADGYISYDNKYASSMLMNGLKECDLSDVKIAEINSKSTWVIQLDNFGGRMKSDGLDNFEDLMYDPISVEVSRDYHLPDNYHEALIYANNLLVDNKYTTHIDLSTNRYRTNEVIAAYFYKAMTDAYKDYTIQIKHGRRATMSIPIDAVINLVLEGNTTSDLSVFQPLLELESRAAVSTKGVTGLNTERAYNMQKRGYDDSMVNVIAQSTGFASTAGVNRTMSINPAIVGGRGYIKKTKESDMNVTNTLSMTEALSPFMLDSDDPFRNAMTFVQTSQHSTPIEYGSPTLVTMGADAAMPYLCSDMFCHKAKKSGTVKEITDDYLLVEYNDKTTEYVPLQEQTMKNSSGGFYIPLQLTTDLKVGSKVKQDTILAYDKKSFSGRVGNGQLSYNMGCLVKTAILSTEDGFEDSGVASEWVAKAMSTDIVVMKDVDLPALTNVLYLAKKGQEVKEGEPILIFQNAYDEEDANYLLKNLNNEDNDVTEIGRNIVKSKVTGVISDIKIYRTVDKDKLSDSLRKIVNKYESDINKLKKIADKAENDVHFDSTDKLPQNGKLKDVDGVLIEIYMKYHDKMKVGDKLSSNANKQVLMSVYKDSDSPYTDFRPNEPIDTVSSASAIDGRIITSPLKMGASYKCMIELGRKVCDIMGVPWKTIHEMYEEDMNNNK